MSEFLNYAGKRVVVSGCFSGMGEATARTLLSLGAEVHGLDYKPTALKLASFTQVDLRDPASIETAAKSIGGRVDALFNCAGLAQTFPPLDVMRVNYMGTRHLTEQLVPYMGKGSAICSISSTAGFGWMRRIADLIGIISAGGFAEGLAWCEANLDQVKEGYSLSKELIIVWTQLTAAHLIKQGIRMNCILPGPTETPMMKEFLAATAETVIDAAAQPINRRSTPQEQANALLFLNSDLASYVNGVPFPVDGGFVGGVLTGQVDLSAMMAAAAG